MNRIKRKLIEVTSGAIPAGSSTRAVLPLDIPDGLCAQVVNFELYIPARAAGVNVLVACLGKGRINSVAHLQSSAALIQSGHMLEAIGTFENVVGAAGLGYALLKLESYLWHYDYRMAANPTLVVGHTAAAITVAVGMRYVEIPCSEDERNAIIAWQGNWGRTT